MHFQLEQGPKIGFVVSTGPRGHIHLSICLGTLALTSMRGQKRSRFSNITQEASARLNRVVDSKGIRLPDR
jgi:hypothetical protein